MRKPEERLSILKEEFVAFFIREEFAFFFFTKKIVSLMYYKNL